jgi:hypothetical protein
MDTGRLLAETVALELLARDGIGAIGQLHIVASDAFRAGYPRAAQVLLDIAEAAEQAVASRINLKHIERKARDLSG